MKKMKIMTVVGTRPEIIRLSMVIKKLEKYSAIKHVLVHTGQNYDYELNEVFFKDFSLRKPDYFLEAATGKPMETIGNILISLDPILEDEQPDAILILGDTNSCLSAIAAKRRHIPIFHMEAGNRCFDLRVPEETNRMIVDHIADINLPYSNIAREYLLREGLSPDKIIKTGSPMYEVITNMRSEIDQSDILDELNLVEGKYFVISAHREENIKSDRNFYNLVDSINEIANKYEYPVIFSTHPRTMNRIRKVGIKFHDLVRNIKPLGFNDYINLQINSFAVLSDSGTISEETSILNLNALNIREAHERPEAMEEGAVMMVGLEKERILQGLSIIGEQKNRKHIIVKDYEVPNVSEKVVKIILSYINYVSVDL
ncbi:UDP-2,3-diacetamido-2,3-dideoxy-D-glucuronate 2-epimerase [Candidatus Izimaplasma bacterium HR1]|jgi:UDP-N-acetylglucosamine 2-epimerase (non-hydrolysing)|uniref:non-hydrolyzing UDP-N-acetylglucosamine 2-epimerase n=1 Tax=Candidatus Izimoplasma sp. HR1 TaxID=1541959 RepID=UPI0004F89DAA|nr:UDP-2,3-diacetamido-2,3-dideoxy-D-glucuronate 2-epimerase [Candidatus Izimaplasma bacterium HR1]